MNSLKKRYRDYIKDRHGSIHKVENTASTIKKRWRINRDHIRDTFIDEYNHSGYRPNYLITVSYWYDEYDRKQVQKNNKRINDVVGDFFNPKQSERFITTLDHFIEVGKKKLVKTKPKLVKGLMGMEYDWDTEIEEGTYHSHSLMSYIPDECITKPLKKVRDAIDRVYGIGEIPCSLRDDEGLEQVKVDLLNYAIRNRCDFIGNGKESLDITPTDEYGVYDGYKGWKGSIAYVTKDMYNVDKILEVYDQENSSILGGL